jgi:hypothetical protein
MQSHTHTLVRFGILQLSETKRPDYKASSCTTTQFGQTISCASIQRCLTRLRVRRNTRVDQMRYEFCHIFKLCSAYSARLLYLLVPKIDSLSQVRLYFRSHKLIAKFYHFNQFYFLKEVRILATVVVPSSAFRRRMCGLTNTIVHY